MRIGLEDSYGRKQLMVRTRAACFEGVGKVSLRELDLKPADDQVLVKIHQASVCGTDKLFFRGEIPEEAKLPIFPWGHEGGGTVVEAGSKVREFSEGDIVMSFSVGTYADYCLFTLPYGCMPAPEGVDIDVACLGEPLSCAVYGAQVVTRNMRVADVVAVVGVGFAGQVIAQGVRKGGAERVIVIDLVDEKLQLARRLGADVAVNAEVEDPVKVVGDVTGGRGADVVVEASGSGDGLNLASSIVRHNGTIAIYSHYMKPFTVNMYRWHEDCLNVINTCLVHRTREEAAVGVREAFRLIRKGVFNINPLINRRYSLSEIADAFKKEMEDRTSIKSVVIP